MERALSLGFVAYPVADFGRAIAFYRDVVGLGEATIFNTDWAEFDLGNATFALEGSAAALGIPPGSASGAAFEVNDYDAAVERLREHGAGVFNEFDGPTCRAAFVRDPEGNAFIIHARK
jgi:predicted enzyme related to lactoylglutathione lyase